MSFAADGSCVRQVSGPNALPFTTAKQTLLLAFLNSALPPSSTGLSALGITSVVQDYESAAANVSLAALVNSNHEAFEGQLNSSSVLTNVDKQFTLSNLTGYSVSVVSMAAAPQLSIASQVCSFPDRASSMLGGSQHVTQQSIGIEPSSPCFWL